MTDTYALSEEAKAVTGKHTVYLIFKKLASASDSNRYIINVDWFKFFNEDDENEIELTGENAKAALEVDPGYAVGDSYFVYDEASKLYKRFQFGGETMDGTTEEQVAVKNIILQICDCHVIEGDEKGRLDLNNLGTGSGYYITNGKYVPITWEKTDEYAPVHYYYEDGTEVALNRGQSWICTIEAGDAEEGVIDISGGEEETESSDDGESTEEAE